MDEAKEMFILTEIAIFSMLWGIVAVPHPILDTVLVTYMMTGFFLLVDICAGEVEHEIQHEKIIAKMRGRES